MSRERLDDLLDGSAPAAQTIGARDVRAMMTDARREVRVAPRAKRAAVISGSLALLMVGGAGVAVAADYWSSLNNPVATYEYQVPSGATCEVVFGDVQIVERGDRDLRQRIEDDLEAWFDRTDVVGVALSQVDEYMQQRSVGLAEAGQPEGELSGVELDTAYGYAIDHSISDQAMAELERLGYAADVASYGSESRCPDLGR